MLVLTAKRFSFEVRFGFTVSMGSQRFLQAQGLQTQQTNAVIHQTEFLYKHNGLPGF